MRFSVLLPTKDRLEYLKLALASVRRQDFDDWEVVVADNCSSVDVEGFVRSLGDARIRCLRAETPIAVTANWNRALGASEGEYVIMLGDDDALLDGYFNSMSNLIDAFEQPDLLYTGALLFSYPGANPDHPEGFLQQYSYASFLRGRSDPFVLDPAEAKRVVQQFMRFRCEYGFNSQFALFSRPLLDRLEAHGPVFQSPFPDYYSMNAAFLTASRIVVHPAPHVVIGVTKKSYGHFHHARDETGGTAFLGNDTWTSPEDEELIRTVLPGTSINTSWLRSAATLATNFGDAAPSWHRGRYRRLQAVDLYEQIFVHGSLPAAVRSDLRRRLSLTERAALCLTLDVVVLLTSRMPRLRRRALSWIRMKLGQYIAWDTPKAQYGHENIIDVLDHVGPVATTSR